MQMARRTSLLKTRRGDAPNTIQGTASPPRSGESPIIAVSLGRSGPRSCVERSDGGYAPAVREAADKVLFFEPCKAGAERSWRSIGDLPGSARRVVLGR